MKLLTVVIVLALMFGLLLTMLTDSASLFEWT